MESTKGNLESGRPELISPRVDNWCRINTSSTDPGIRSWLTDESLLAFDLNGIFILWIIREEEKKLTSVLMFFYPVDLIKSFQ